MPLLLLISRRTLCPLPARPPGPATCRRHRFVYSTRNPCLLTLVCSFCLLPSLAPPMFASERGNLQKLCQTSSMHSRRERQTHIGPVAQRRAYSARSEPGLPGRSWGAAAAGRGSKAGKGSQRNGRAGGAGQTRERQQHRGANRAGGKKAGRQEQLQGRPSWATGAAAAAAVLSWRGAGVVGREGTRGEGWPPRLGCQAGSTGNAPQALPASGTAADSICQRGYAEASGARGGQRGRVSWRRCHPG